MPIPEVTVLGIYEGDKLIFEGTRKEVAERFSIKESTTYVYTRKGNLLLGKYEVRKNGVKPKKYDGVWGEGKNRLKKVVKEEEMTPFQYLKVHLEKYGNTGTRRDPSPYLEDLKKIGLNVKVEKRPDMMSKYLTVSEKARKKGKVSYYYYLEVI